MLHADSFVAYSEFILPTWRYADGRHDLKLKMSLGLTVMIITSFLIL